ncbi:MAG: type II/IV secretion system ATPase subunit, partial [Nitrososphaeria archaeon]
RTVPAAVAGEIVNEYNVGPVRTIVSNAGTKYHYTVIEPELTERERQVYSQLMEAVYYAFKPAEGDQVAILEQFLWKASEDLGIFEEFRASYEGLKYYLVRDSLGYGIVDALMKDDHVEEISCEGWDRPVAIMHRMHPGADWMDTNIKFESEDELSRFVQKIVMRSGKAISTAVPYVDATMPDGSRLASTFGSEISLPGSSFDVRKFPKSPFTILHLIREGVMTPLLASYYWLIVEAKGFTFIIGATGSGKTTTLNALLQLINPNLKVATVEETPEISLPHEHWERLRTRYTFSGSEAAGIDIFDLTKLTLRIRPDYLIVGESRGAEIQFLFQASASGHGSFTTFHGDSVESAIARMTTEPLNVGHSQLMLVWSFLQVNRVRLESGQVVRRAMVSKEVDPLTGELTEIFRWDPRDGRMRPETVEEVISRSARLKTLVNLWGWDEKRLGEEMSGRIDFFRKMLAENRCELPELSDALREFYAAKYYRKISH